MLSASKLKESIENIKSRVKSAAQRAGRNPDDITIVAVTKTVGAETLKVLSELGWKDIGENRVQDTLDKAKSLGTETGFAWHMIGHLQTNKAKKAVGLFDWIHSLDSLHLAEELQKEAVKANKTLRVLIEVNVSTEASKGGIRPEELTDFYRKVKAALRPGGTSERRAGLVISGLMTMAPLSGDPEASRPWFRKLRELRDKLKSDFIDAGGSEELKYLSMGMSQDFEVAAEEGANILRIGTAIFKE
ncbi:MAG: YggS family pyridoxal phosphate-dependent enzyme [Planctomycetota bacterium]